MQVVGVGLAGASSLRGATVAVVDVRPPPSTTGSANSPRAGEQQRLAAETVVFPRDGARSNALPADVRRRNARMRYARDGELPAEDSGPANAKPSHARRG
jgi:hypothetical protein